MDPSFTAKRRTARVAGLWYFIMLITGPVGLIYAPSQIVVAGDAAATAQNIVSHGMLLRTGIVSSIVCQVAFVFLVVTLYELLKDVDRRKARLMVALVVAAVPIAIINELFPAASLLLQGNASYLAAIHPDELDSLSMFFLSLHDQGTQVVGVFWGLWLLPFGLLVMKSGFIPRIIGIFLVMGCFSYLFNSATAMLLPEYRGIIGAVLTLPLAIGEFSAVFWLLIKGVRAESRAATSASSGH